MISYFFVHAPVLEARSQKQKQKQKLEKLRRSRSRSKTRGRGQSWSQKLEDQKLETRGCTKLEVEDQLEARSRYIITRLGILEIRISRIVQYGIVCILTFGLLCSSHMHTSFFSALFNIEILYAPSHHSFTRPRLPNCLRLLQYSWTS